MPLFLKRGVPVRWVKKNMLNIVKMEIDEFSFAFAAMTFYCVACKERIGQALTLLWSDLFPSNLRGQIRDQLEREKKCIEGQCSLRTVVQKKCSFSLHVPNLEDDSPCHWANHIVITEISLWTGWQIQGGHWAWLHSGLPKGVFPIKVI